MKRVVIIGGGVVGLSSAFYLTRKGHTVTIIDKGDMVSGCSYGNAGMIVPSHFVPLAAPGMISKGIRWMFNPASPFYVRPALSRDLLRWGWIFYRSATREKVAASAPALKELSMYSKSCYESLAAEIDIDLQHRGLLMLYRRKETGEEEMEMVEMAHKIGVQAKLLSSTEVQSMEPNVTVTALGGIFFPGDAHLTPHTLMASLKARLIESGVRLMTDHTVTGFEVKHKTVTGILTDGEKYPCDEAVLAAGSWSSGIADKLGITIPMQSGKGYSFTLKNLKRNLTIPTILLDDRVAITPMGQDLRFGGTMEIGGKGGTIDMRRVKGIVESVPKHYPELQVEMPQASDVWSGLRPCSPDGLPYIGRVKHLENLTIATGHGMMGISLGPGTGSLVAEMIDGQSLAVDIAPFQADRFN